MLKSIVDTFVGYHSNISEILFLKRGNLVHTFLFQRGIHTVSDETQIMTK